MLVLPVSRSPVEAVRWPSSPSSRQVSKGVLRSQISRPTAVSSRETVSVPRPAMTSRISEATVAPPSLMARGRAEIHGQRKTLGLPYVQVTWNASIRLRNEHDTCLSKFARISSLVIRLASEICDKRPPRAGRNLALLSPSLLLLRAFRVSSRAQRIPQHQRLAHLICRQSMLPP